MLVKLGNFLIVFSQAAAATDCVSSSVRKLLQYLTAAGGKSSPELN